MKARPAGQPVRQDNPPEKALKKPLSQ